MYYTHKKAKPERPDVLITAKFASQKDIPHGTDVWFQESAGVERIHRRWDSYKQEFLSIKDFDNAYESRAEMNRRVHAHKSFRVPRPKPQDVGDERDGAHKPGWLFKSLHFAGA